MVKVLFLGLLVAMMCGLVSAVPAPQLARSIRPEVFPSSPTIPSSPVLEDPATRSERSTNLSYITGTARKIQLFIKNRHLQLLSDGTVNGTTNASSAYTEKFSTQACCPRTCPDPNSLSRKRRLKAQLSSALGYPSSLNVDNRVRARSSMDVEHELEEDN